MVTIFFSIAHSGNNGVIRNARLGYVFVRNFKEVRYFQKTSPLLFMHIL